MVHGKINCPGGLWTVVATAVATLEGVLVLGCASGVAARVLLLDVRLQLLPLTLAKPLLELIMLAAAPKFFRLPIMPMPLCGNVAELIVLEVLLDTDSTVDLLSLGGL
uniref:Uncharacterized protein n=1 Tax=Glossina brevipalpis TaxID=37001 RepID=A0A1A9WGC9_9MUSC